MTQTLVQSPITLLTDRFDPGLSDLECRDRWFIISALANHLLNGCSFVIIVDRLDPDALIEEWVCELLYDLDGAEAHDVWLLLHAIVSRIEEEG